VNQAAQTAAVVGAISPGVWNGVTILNLSAGTYLPSGYLAQAASYATQTQANQEAGQAMPIYLAVILSGAVESILVGLYVQL
jgi:hypothetical protein